MAAGVAGIGAPVEDPVVDQPGEAVGKHRLGDVEVAAEVVEVAYAVEGVADDQQRPALADHLKRAGERTVLTCVTPCFHAGTLP
jgi:hypothetical protein